jgi:hypothetical protein
MLVAAAVAIPAHAQGVESVRRGARVRVEVEGEQRTGVLEERGPDTLWVRFNRTDTVPIPLARVQRLEVSRERRSNAGQMAVVGLMIGIVPGVVAGATCDCGEPGLAALVFGAATGGLGAALGAGLGATGKHDVWEVVPLVMPAENAPPVVGIRTVIRVRLR